MQFHNALTGKPVSVNPEMCCRIMPTAKGTMMTFMDGGSEEVTEAYPAVEAALGWDRPQKLEK
jgi:hypothetical protein